MEHLNGIEEKVPWLYRTKDKKAPHNAYASGERIQKAIEAMGYSQEYPESYTGHYRFSKRVSGHAGEWFSAAFVRPDTL